jgi:hypothetical protein
MSTPGSTNILDTINAAVSNGLLNLPATAFGSGTFYQAAIVQFLDGQNLQITLSATPTGGQAQATVSGSGVNQWLGKTTVIAVFTLDGTNVSLSVKADIAPGWSLASAWPAVLSGYPFSNVTITNGAFDLEAKSTEVTLAGALSAAWNGSALGSAWLEVQDSAGTLGFGLGASVGSFSPGDLWEPLKSLTFTDAGVFVSTVSGLAPFDGTGTALTFPKTVDKGLTVYADLAIAGDIAILKPLLGGTTTLNLVAFTDGADNTTLDANVQTHIVVGSLTITGFTLEWNISKQSLTITGASTIALPGNESLDLDVDGTLGYGATPSASVDMVIANWANPFGISFLTVDDFGIGVTLNEEGMDLEAGGKITIGTGDDKIDVELILAVEDFEIPSGLVFEATEETAGQMITLPNLVGAFVPSLGTAIGKLPFVNDFGFTNLTLIVAEAPFAFNKQQYAAGLGATGDISFFSWTLDFAFQVGTSGVSASGSINKPIEVTVGSVTLVKLSDATGQKGPAGSIDTTKSPYFTLTAGLSLLGLVNASVDAYVGDDNFTFDAQLSLFDVLNASLSCSLDPKALNFAGSANFSVHLPSLTLPALTIDGVQILPSIQLTPDISASFGLSISSSPPSFGFSLAFSIAGMSVSVNPTFDLTEVETALSDFGTFIKNWLVNNVKALFQDILNVARDLAQFLKNLGEKAEQAIVALAKLFAGDVTKIVNDVWTAAKGCAATAANELLTADSAAAQVDSSKALVALTRSDAGQTLLEHYYQHETEIGQLVASHPAVLAGIRAAQGESPATNVLPALHAAVVEMQKVGSPELAASAQAVLPTLATNRDKSWGEFVDALNRPAA